MPPRYELDDIIVRAELAAVLALGDDHSPLSRVQVMVIACSAVWAEAQRAVSRMQPDALEAHLTLHAVRMLYEARSGLGVDRPLLVQRIRDLPRDQQVAYALRYEHGMSDAQIAEVVGLTEDAVASLMLRALQHILGVSDDTRD